MTQPSVLPSLTAFLRARLDEDIAVARQTLTSSWLVGAGGPPAEERPAQALTEAVIRRGLLDGAAVAERDGRPDHAHTVRRELALAYVAHPDFRPEWRPSARAVD